MKLFLAIALFLVMIFVGVSAYSFFNQEQALNKNLSDVQSQLTAAQSQEADLDEETQYLSNPVNLEKEFRTDFNYKKPGETMIIIVPAATSSTTP